MAGCPTLAARDVTDEGCPPLLSVCALICKAGDSWDAKADDAEGEPSLKRVRELEPTRSFLTTFLNGSPSSDASALRLFVPGLLA